MIYRHVYGHESQISFLQQVASFGKTAHAYLFVGPDGIGKRLVAVSFAASLLCPDGGCGSCPVCERTIKGTHPDTIHISPVGSNIRIQDIREAIMATAIRPLEGSKRIIIINEADLMSEPAANAVLKTLEEPRRGNVFLLITARPHKLSLTITSRCQILSFSPLSGAQLTSFLADKTDLPKEKIEIIAALAEGSVSKALFLARGEYLSLREGLKHTLKQAIESKNLAPVILSRFLAQEKIEIEEKLNILTSLFRDALWFRETGSREGIVNLDFIDVIKILAQALDPGQMIKNIQILARANQNLEQNVNKSLTLEASLFSLSFP